MKRCQMPFEALLDYQEGRASIEEATRVRAHLDAGCSACQRQLARIERLLTTLAEADRLHAPDIVMERARAIYRDRFRAPVRRSWIARLTLDGRAGLATAGVRGEDAQDFQLLYSTDDHDLDLWEEREEAGTWYLIGQVLAKSSRTAILPETAKLIAQDGNTIVATSEGDEFHLSSLRPGTYELRLQLGDGEIVVPEVSVGL